MGNQKKEGTGKTTKVRDLGKGKKEGLSDKDLDAVSGGRPLSCGFPGDDCDRLRIGVPYTTTFYVDPPSSPKRPKR